MLQIWSLKSRLETWNLGICDSLRLCAHRVEYSTCQNFPIYASKRAQSQNPTFQDSRPQICCQIWSIVTDSDFPRLQMDVKSCMGIVSIRAKDCVWLSSDSVICDSDTGDATAHHDHHATRSQDKLTVTRCSTFQEEGTLSPAQKHIPDSGRGSAKVQNRHTGEYD